MKPIWIADDEQHHGLIEVDSVPGRPDFKILIPLP